MSELRGVEQAVHHALKAEREWRARKWKWTCGLCFVSALITSIAVSLPILFSLPLLLLRGEVMPVLAGVLWSVALVAMLIFVPATVVCAASDISEWEHGP